MSQDARMKTITYSRVAELDIKLDLYIPTTLSPGPKAALVFFHGGGMITGGRKTLYFQKWLLNSVIQNDILFISADYRLIWPSTGLDIIEDVKRLFGLLGAPDFSTDHLPEGITLDHRRIAVCGESGGGYPARAAGIFADPKPKAVFLQYAMGGELLDDHWLAVKDKSTTAPEFQDATRAAVAHMLDTPQQPISYDPVIALGEEPLSPGQGQSMRGALLPYWLVAGELLDYVLGDKISSTLRQLPYDERINAVPEKLREGILQNQLDASFPPTFLLHGKDDFLILSSESRRTYDTLQALGVKVVLRELEGAGHTLRKPQSGRPDPNKAPELVQGAEDFQKEGFAFLLAQLRI